MVSNRGGGGAGGNIRPGRCGGESWQGEVEDSECPKTLATI
jgi:hypothetical protein